MGYLMFTPNLTKVYYLASYLMLLLATFLAALFGSIGDMKAYKKPFSL